MKIFERTFIIAIIILIFVYSLGFKMLAAEPSDMDMERLDAVSSTDGYFWDDIDSQRDLSEYVDPEHGKYLDSGYGDWSLDNPNLTTDQSIAQIRYCVVFLTFGIIPVGLSTLIVFFLCRWIYRLVVHSV